MTLQHGFMHHRMRPPVTTNLTQNTRTLHAETLADLALLAIGDVCDLVRMSPSWVHDEIRAGRFPQPLRFGPRCSRWTVASIRTWLAERTASPPEGVAAMTSARAKKASDAARRKRTERAATTA